MCEPWLDSACLCFALDRAEQERTRFRSASSISPVEDSRNLLVQRGSQLEQVFHQLVDRTRARLAVPPVKTLFGAKRRPPRGRKPSPPRVAVVVETPASDLTVFKVHFGSLTLKASTTGERVLGFEVVVHNPRELGCGRVVARFPEIVARLQGILDRFLITLDCVDLPCISDHLLDQLPLPSHLGRTPVAGGDVNQPRIRAALASVLALGASPNGFSVAQFRAQVHARTGPGAAESTVRQAAYDLKKLRGKPLLVKRGARRSQPQPASLRAIAALLVLRDHVIGPLLAGVGSQRSTRRPTPWTTLDQHYERLRLDIQPLFKELGIAA